MSRLWVGSGISRKPRLWIGGLSSGKLILASEPAAFRLFGAPVARALGREGLSVSCHLLPSGERAKTWQAVSGLLSAMLKAGLGRDSGLLALGGGAVTDSAGFAAAIYLRGIPWLSLPTTLLGQLDSGIGGKTGINLPEGKNLAGAFHMPLSSVCDVAFLESLPGRERISGLAEAIKVGLVFEPGLWRFIQRNWPGLLQGEPAATESAVRRTASWKMRVVSRDERETRGLRELLNFGHTLGHALERASGYGSLRHGEAVVWGMRLALRLSVEQAGLSPKAAAPVEEFLKSIPVTISKGISPRWILEAARLDKKVRGGSIRFVLLKALGRPVVKAVSENRILKAIREALP